MSADGGWIALFSGGKESSWALYRALESGCDVRRLVIVTPQASSGMYHAPATSVARLAARSIGIPVVDAGVPTVDVEPPDVGGDLADGRDGDASVEPLESAVGTLDVELDGGVAGILVGSVENELRIDRLRSICDDVGCDLLAPLWRAEPRELLETMIDAGLEIVVVEVTAPGFDESWLGRRLDRDALDELAELHRERDVHLLGEGGEFETIVTDGPHMSRPVVLEFEREWYDNWGRLRITDARLDTHAPKTDRG
ncbi:diphthine--ammonia ligase [Natrialbaceae archaeon AArc-T1-2]|uniref:diphthine--ammonia ligase n=1 Tax=Natrialbaceae archaeon AArc-T1-2 TaxID=3053904 RepID=UPI00255AC1AC|nr:diphthine--ammonia ligase [Natrialbaceae archaeon AArc-T1-2]WIV66086.1 diphthine--ammonia ligase [Natrialbaceae archaeon AArc-T1-2]